MKVTHEEMKAARVPLLFRDYCAHILIPLNECRVKHWYSPFQCTELRHSYEKWCAPPPPPPRHVARPVCARDGAASPAQDPSTDPRSACSSRVRSQYEEFERRVQIAQIDRRNGA